MAKLITDKKEAGTFTRKVIAANMEKFSKFDSPKSAFEYFTQHYSQVNITYDNFWYHLKVAKKAAGITDAPVTNTSKAKTSKADSEDLSMPDVDIEMLPAASIADVEIKVYNPKKEKVNEEIFVPYPSGKFIDNIISKKIGCMPGTTVVMTGGPSVGKTTMALDTLHNAKSIFMEGMKKSEREAAENEFMYFSSEMKKIDIQAMQDEMKWMSEIRSVLMNEYPKNQYKAIVEKVICHGYRFLLIDSFQDIVERLQSFCSMTTSTAANFLLNCIEKANIGDTETGHCTAILLIQQVTKGGVFVGKNSLKHNTTAMLELKFDNDLNRYCEFTKNRRNGKMVFKRLYYGLDENNEVTYDQKRFEEDRERENIIAKERNSMAENIENFNKTFLSGPRHEEDEDDLDEAA